MNLFRKKLDRASIAKKRGESESALRRLAYLPTEEALSSLSTLYSGLTDEQAQERLEEFGPNIIVSGKQSSVFSRLAEAFVNPFNIVLFLIAAITFITDVLLSLRPDYATVIVILGLILVSSIISFIQSERSSAAAAKLSAMISNKADVLRNGAYVELDISQIVPGDIIRLSAGDMLPGDVLFLTAKDAFIAQSALTGESNPVEKYDHPRGEGEALTDIANLGFMGSNMVSGSATAVVAATGNNTYFGSMAKALSGDRAKNSFEQGIDSVSRLLLRFMLIMVPIIFLINGFAKNDWGNALLFAVTIAVGLTPEMLPVIMTSTLARGAVNMAKHKTIVKTLSAIQAFGEMDVLCTDKTGTLTEDKIVLEKYMDLHGEDDQRVLRHAFLNSYFQTGLKNLIDVAVIERAKKNGLGGLIEEYRHVDEIPFDFSRRRMSVVLEDTSGKRQLITKGAVEEVLSICSYADFGGEIRPLDSEHRRLAEQIYAKHNFDGLRMLAVAQKNQIREAGAFDVSDEQNMVLMGFIGFLDPPKQSAAAAITALNEHGVRVVVLTGDSEGVAVKVCSKVGVPTEHCLTGVDVEAMSDKALIRAVRECCLFSKLSPAQKQRVVAAFQANGHTVGYMGDGINDTLAMRQSDVGISVDSAVDIAKETADIILLKKDLMVLEEGVLEGRRTFGNIMKYIKMAASGNFGNMISVVLASILLPFLPLKPVQILTQNLLCDFAQLGIPFDRVDESYLSQPRKWDTGSIQKFMFSMGPLSCIFDLCCYAILWWAMGANTMEHAALFQCGNFVYGTLSQILVVHMIRTEKIPFAQSRPAAFLMATTLLFSALTLGIGFSGFAAYLDMAALPLAFLPWLLLLLAGYCLGVQLIKRFYKRAYGYWL